MSTPGEKCDDIVAAIDRALGEDGSVAEGQSTVATVYDGEYIHDPAEAARDDPWVWTWAPPLPQGHYQHGIEQPVIINDPISMPSRTPGEIMRAMVAEYRQGIVPVAEYQQAIGRIGFGRANEALARIRAAGHAPNPMPLEMLDWSLDAPAIVEDTTDGLPANRAGRRGHPAADDSPAARRRALTARASARHR